MEKCLLLLLAVIVGNVRCQAGEDVAATHYKKPEIVSLHVYSDIKYRFATTLVTSRVKNAGTQPREAIFDVTLPNEAFITNLTIEENGKIIVGEIKKKEVARRQYEAARERGESAGYIGTKHRETNRFNLAITVAPLSKVFFNLTYQELLQRKNGRYEQVVYIDPGQIVDEMQVSVNILESRNITHLNVPPLRNDVGADLIVLDTLTVINQPDPKSASVLFVPSKEQQLEQSDSGIAGQFVVQYDVERGMDAGDILLVNGYFVHFFAPEGLEPIPNDVLFILDNSGSMSGLKMRQLKEAMNSILSSMNEGDRINIMTFASNTFMWQQNMMDINDEDNMEDAKAFVNKINARGSTNINLALTSGIEFMHQLWERNPRTRSPVIVFLTDGEATTGETGVSRILSNVREANSDSKVSIFSLAFGEGADYTFVKSVAIQNNGFGKRIYAASDASLQIAGFYNEISMTLLKNLTFQYLDAPVSNLTKHHYENYFNGSEVIVCGLLDMYNDRLEDNLRLQVESKSASGSMVLVMNNEILEPEFDSADNMTGLGDYEQITEKVWAYLTIKQLLDEELASSVREEKLPLKKRILDLSLKYGFVTPLTSMVVTKTDVPELSDEEAGEEEELLVAQSADMIPPTGKTLGYPSHSMTGQSLPAGASTGRGGPGHRRRYKQHGRPLSHPGRQPSHIRKMSAQSGGSLHPRKAHDQPPPIRHFKKFDALPELAEPPMPRPTQSQTPPVLNYPVPDSGAYMPPMPTPRPTQSQTPPVLNYPVPDSDDPKNVSPVKTSKKKGKKSKGKKKGTRKTKAYPLPMMVTVKDVATRICFNLYDDQLLDGDRYLLYEEMGPDGNVQITVTLEERRFSKKKIASGIVAVAIKEGNETTIITSSGSGELDIQHIEYLNGTKKGDAYMEKDFTLNLDEFDLYVDSADDKFVNIAITSVDHKKKPSDNGILGSILSKKIKERQPKSTKPKKKKKKNQVLLKVNKTTVKTMLLTDVPFSENSSDALCLLSRKESVFYDLQQYKI